MAAGDGLIAQLEAIIDRTPDGGEGSRFHLRSQYLWDLRDDLRRIDEHDEAVVNELGADSFGEARTLCLQDAHATLNRWRNQDEERR